jgi:hypothetical protein
VSSKVLQYAHFKSSAVDHLVKDVAFGGAITLWCDWEGTGVEFAKEPRVRGRICLDCQNNRLTARRGKIEHSLGEAGCWIKGGHTLAEHNAPQVAPF